MGSLGSSGELGEEGIEELGKTREEELHRVGGRGGSKGSEGQRRWSGDRAHTLQSEVSGDRGPRGWVVRWGWGEAESEGTSALEDRGWVPSCCRACGRRGGIGGAEPKGMVSGRGAGVLKGQRRRARGSGLEPAGWRAGRGGPGSGSQGPMCPPLGPGSKATTSGFRRDGRSHAQRPRENMSTSPRVRGPNPNPPRSRRSVRDSAASLSRGGAGAGTQKGPTLPFQDWLLRIAFLFHWLYLLP